MTNRLSMLVAGTAAREWPNRCDIGIDRCRTATTACHWIHQSYYCGDAYVVIAELNEINW